MLGYVFGIAVICILVERFAPGWKLPAVRTWPTRVVLVNLVQVGIVLLAGATWEVWLSAHSLFHLSAHWGAIGGGVLAYFVATFVFYW
jgi:hypothetical protein